MEKFEMRRLALAAATCLLLTACGSDSWFGESTPPPLPGKRISVLAHARSIEAESKALPQIILPGPENVGEWPQAGGYPPHAMHHLELGDNLRKVWSADVGVGNDKRRALLSQPVATADRVFAMDAEAQVSAFALKDGRRLWRQDLTPKDADEGTYGGGLAYDEGKLFATTGFGEIVTMDANSGKVLWRQQLPSPVRGAPTIRGGRILMITVDNETLALSAEDGHALWHHNGISEVAAMIGGSSVAVDGNVVIVPYTSGELFALRIENGTTVWNENISGVKRTDQVANLTDIRGLPIVYDNRVYVAGNSDIVTAIDLRTGRRVWDREVGSIRTPWIAGNYLYLLTNAPEVVCFDAKSGQVLWVTPLQGWRDEEDKKGRIVWTGPVLASDRLIVASGEGEALAISPYTGKMLGRIELPDGISISPIIANDTLIFLTDDGDLVAYR